MSSERKGGGNIKWRNEREEVDRSEEGGEVERRMWEVLFMWRNEKNR